MINQFGNAFTGSLNVIGLIAAIVVLAGYDLHALQAL